MKKTLPKIEKEIFELGIPILGMCYGMQFMKRIHWVAKLNLRTTVNLVKTPTKVDTTSPLFKGLEEDKLFGCPTLTM